MYINAKNEEIVYNSIETNEFLTISMAGLTNPNPSYHIIHNINKHFFYDYYVFEYVISGKGYIEYNDGKIMVEAGDFYFLNKLSKHIYYSDKDDPYKKIFIVTKGSFIDSLVSSFNINETVIVKKANTEEILRNIHTEITNDKTDYQKISHFILELFYNLGKDLFRTKNETIELTELVRKYLDSQIAQRLTLEKVSKDLNISKSHIERIFKERYSITPMAYFMKKKTEYACALLINTSYTISEISDQAGFYDSKYMSKCIKKATGLSPLQYRKEKAK
jgi:AraC-like DNA-binding protein